MASSSSVARVLRKSAASLLFRTRTTNLTETVRNTGPAVQGLLRSNQTPAIQYPVFSQTFPVMQSGFHVGFIQKETFRKMEAGQGKPVVESGDSEEDETDFDDDDIDDIDVSEDDEFDDIEEDEEECTRKMNK